MSPSQNPSGRQPACLIGSQVASSNSTANRFLGASRKPWMTSNPSNLLACSEPNRLPSSNLTTFNTTSSPTGLSNAYTHREIPAGSVLGPSIQKQGVIAHYNYPSTTSRPAERAVNPPLQVAPASPLTPSATNLENGTDLLSDAGQRPSSHAPTIGTTGSASATNAAIFPSPEPSNTSHASPVATLAESDHPPNDLRNNEATATERTPTAYTPRTGAPITGGQRTTPQPSARSPLTIDTYALPPPAPSQPEVADSPSPNNNGIWSRARSKLGSYLAMSTKNHSLSESVELPRLRILQDVCVRQDMFYLALHQTFCINSSCPSHLQAAARFGINPDLDYGVIAQLLVDNKRLSADFVNWSVSYPLPLGVLVKIVHYQNALKQVATCLNMISKNWVAFERDLRARGHPPQVDELVLKLGMVSPVFQTIAFTAFSRRLFGSREDLFKACMTLFEEDQKTYLQRFALEPHAKHKAMSAYLEKYRQLCSSHSLPRQPYSVNIVHRSKSTSAANPALSSNKPLTTSAGLPKNQQAPLANSIQASPFTCPPNIQSTTAYPLSSNSAPNQSTLSTMASSIGSQQYQLPFYPGPIQDSRTSAQHVQTRPEYVHQIQPPTAFPSQPSNIVTSVASAPSFTNHMPLHFQHYQYSPAHMNLAFDGTGPLLQNTNGIAQNVHMNVGPSFPHPSFAMPQIPSPAGEPVHRPMYSPTGPQPGLMSVTLPATIPMRPQRHSQQSMPAIPSPSLTQPTGSPSTGLPNLPWTRPKQSMPRPSIGASAADPSPDIIHYFSSFAVPAQKLPSKRSAFSWKFTVSSEMLQRRSRLVPQGNGRGCIPVLADGDLSFRFRCVKFEGQLDLNSSAAWSHAENSWPDVVYIHVNNIEVYRPPNSNSKNQPLLISPHLREGVNNIRLNILHASRKPANNDTYAVAVEILEVKSPSTFQSLIKTLPAKESRQQIQKRLSSSQNNDDDELMIMDDFISIDLRDPFTTQIFKVPVRGSTCTHRECFDLPTFVQTLLSKPIAGKRALYLRCPICRQDARPDRLIVDEFLVEVRAVLTQHQKLETTKAIRVKNDGSWEGVMEDESDVRTSTRKRNRTSFEADLVKDEQSPAGTPSRAPPAPEVIELD